MSENNTLVTSEQVQKLQDARLVYQGRMRDYINRRAEELVKFGKMQSSVIVQPNQQELHAQHNKIQQIDFEIKRLSDLVWCATILVTYYVKPAIFDNMKNVRDQIKLAYDTVLDVNKDLEKTKVEEVFAVSIIRDMGQFLPSLYPETNPVEEAARVLAANAPENKRHDAENCLSSGLDGLSGSLLVSV